MADNTQDNGLQQALKLGLENYDRDLRGATSPFRKEISPNGSTFDKNIYDVNVRNPLISKNTNYFDILSYQWYTSDIARRFLDDYYYNMDIDYAKVSQANYESQVKGDNKFERAVNTIKDKAVSTVKETYSNVKDTVVDSYNQIKKGVDNLLDRNTDNEEPTNPPQTSKNNLAYFLQTFPFAKVYEFKPQDSIGVAIGAFTEAFKNIDTIVQNKDNSKFSEVIAKIGNNAKQFILDEFKIDLNQFSDPINRINNFPNTLYKNLISGYFTGYYEIPALNYFGFLNSNGSEGWSSNSFVGRFVGEDLANTVKKTLGVGIDIASRPKWSIEGGGNAFPEISFNVTLFNDNLQATLNNLAFIHSFVGGNLWYQDYVIQKSSSLYDVEIPGRFRYYFCTCDIEVKYSGKVRKVIPFYRNNYNENIFLRNLGFKENPADSSDPTDNPNLELLNNIPDAYEVSFSFKSLIPNNFNSYISYVSRNTSDTPFVGQEIKSYYEKFAKVFNIDKTQDEVKEKQKTENSGE